MKKRIERILRTAREMKCRGCGRLLIEPPSRDQYDATRLTASEWAELQRLTSLGSGNPCPRCNRPTINLSGLNDEQCGSLLALLRKLLGPRTDSFPAFESEPTTC